MQPNELIAFAKGHIEAITALNAGPGYRCAARLTDGTYLPAVILQSQASQIAFATRRLEETRPRRRGILGPLRQPRGISYEATIAAFTASGNQVNWYDVAQVEPSPFALPAERLSEIESETSMSWTQFVAVMRDDREFSFGTTYNIEFFHMPDGYSGNDVVRIIPHGKVDGPVYRERPWFACFVEGL
jgi:hypothetical protein